MSKDTVYDSNNDAAYGYGQYAEQYYDTLVEAGSFAGDRYGYEQNEPFNGSGYVTGRDPRDTENFLNEQSRYFSPRTRPEHKRDARGAITQFDKAFPAASNNQDPGKKHKSKDGKSSKSSKSRSSGSKTKRNS